MIITLVHLDELLKKDSIVAFKNPQASLGTGPKTSSLKTSQIILSDLAAALLIQSRDKLGSNDDKLHILSKSSTWLLRSLKLLDKSKDANKAFEKLTGYSQAEIIGRNCRFLQGEDREQEARYQIHAAMEQHQNIEVTLRNYKKNGDLFHNHLKITQLLDR